MQPVAENEDPGVRLVVRVLNALERVMLYELLVRKFGSVRLAWWYVVGSITLLIALLLTTGSWGEDHRALTVAAVVVSAYRMVDIVRWWADLLLDRAHDTVVSEERNLLFALANLIEVGLIGAIWFCATGQASTAGAAFYEAFTLVTQLSIPPAPTVQAKIATAATEVAALLLLLGGVASLIAEVQEKLRRGGWRKGPSDRRPHGSTLDA